MNQHKGAGHHLVTQEATQHLFAGAVHNGTIMGLTEKQFFQKLDKWQEHADRVLGPTWQPYWFVPGAQREHSMGIPSESGADNLQAIRTFILDELALAKGAHLNGNVEAEWKHLGAAVHALEDSYSGAHTFRDLTNPADPYASIQAINTFTLLGSHDTHIEDFDDVPVDNGHTARASDQAAGQGVANLLLLYIQHIDDQPETALPVFTNEVYSLLHGENIQVLTENTAKEFLAERELHYNNEISIDPSNLISHPDDINLTDNNQAYSPVNADISLPDGTTAFHGADGNQANFSQQSQSVDASVSPPDASTFSGAESNQAPHSQQSVTGDANMSMPDGTTTFHPADSNQVNHSQQSHPGDANMSMPDGTTAQVGPDNNLTDSSTQSQSLPGGNNQSNNHPGQTVPHSGDQSSKASSSDTYCYPLDIMAKKGSSPKDHQSRKENQEGGKYFNWQSRNAWDLVVPAGTPVYAVADGQIGKNIGPLVKSDPMLAGLRLTIESDGNKFYYAHLSKFADGIAAGTKVKKGELIGYSGKAGGVEHLHFAAQHENSVTSVLANSQLHYDDHDSMVFSVNDVQSFSGTHSNDGNNITPDDANFTNENGEAVNIEATANMSMPGETAVHYGADSNQIDHPLQSHPDSNFSMPDGTAIHYGADSNQVDLSHHQSLDTDANASIPDGTISHFGPDSDQVDTSQQGYDPSNFVLLSETAVLFAADSNHVNNSQQSYTDSNVSNLNGTPDSNQVNLNSITQFSDHKWHDPYHHAPIHNHVNPFNIPVHHAADSNQIADPNHTHLGDSNPALPHDAVVQYGADSNQLNLLPHGHSDSNSNSPDGTGFHYGADSNQLDLLHHGHSDSNSNSPDGTNLHFGADSNQVDQSHLADHQQQQVQHVAHDDGSQSVEQ